MEESQPDPATVFSLRIVDIDYYMAPPIPEIDICYSSFQGGKVNEVPVIRIFGSTPAGQKTCLHVHKALPYLYVPRSDIQLKTEAQSTDDDYKHAISHALEKALKLKGKVGSKRQHMHACSLVRARRLYGYFSSEELFVKIYLYHPQDVIRAANFLLGGSVIDSSLQPHESHVPFILQFLVDYNLYGMGHIHLSKLKFRNPIPDTVTLKEDSSRNELLEKLTCSPPYSQADLPVWTTSTVPATWMWQVPDALCSSNDHSIQLVKRVSTCKLEGDSTTEDILNQHHKNYLSLSQTSSDVKMVQSLIPIWEEEYERAGFHNAYRDLPPDPGKPRQADVLKILSLGSEFENKIKDMLNDAERLLNPSDEAVNLIQPSQSLNNEAKDVDNRAPCIDSARLLNEPKETPSPCTEKCAASRDEGKNASPKQMLETVGTSIVKSTDESVLGVFKWLASSQAAEDMNSDDDLLCETIVKPLFPATTINKVLEKANIEYESASQLECQDILDSVDDVTDGNCPNSNLQVDSQNQTPHTPLDHGIPQVDCSDGAHYSICGASSSKGCGQSSQPLEHLNDLRSTTKPKTGKQWGALPFSMPGNMDDDLPDAGVDVVDKFENLAKYVDVNRKNSKSILSANDASRDTQEGSSCSFRELIRKKRSYRVSSPDCEASSEKRVHCKEYFYLNSSICSVSEDKLTSSFDHYSHDDRKLGFAVSSPLRRFRTSLSRQTSERLKGSLSNTDEVHICSDETSVPEIESLPLSKVEGEPSHKGIMNSREESTPLDHIQGNMSDEDPSQYAKDSYEDSFQNDDDPLHVQEDAMIVKDSYDEMEALNNCSDNGNDPLRFQQAVTIAPAHHMSDGSVVYLLTPTSLPPTADSVCQWILQDSVSHTSVKRLLDDHPCLSASRDTDKLNREESENEVMVVDKRCNEGEVAQENEAEYLKKKVCNNIYQDVSQISGPDRKSKATPLSQSGFRDPASAGCGQQLTLLSMEVLAEARGDLRSDPRYDAVKVVAFAIKDDSDPTHSSYALLHAPEFTQRNPDGLSGCSILCFSEEKHLFNYLVEVITSLDPDILLGWDIQGGSLGFLTERASHIGISLISRISRTPSEIKLGRNDSEGLENILTDDVLPEHGNIESILPDSGIIEDEWGRTHASGIHVDGRIVLNVWRLMRSEVKLSMYTFEAVAEAVLRRKIPLISNKVLLSWFLSGPSSARYRAIEFVLERAKLNFAIMDQLDMVNRTSELARVFGIEFFSVLSRGSQYRVESMLLRLAHSQNYIAISPGSQQVASQPAMECLPLVMEPKSGFYADPVVVLDFQSLYPSMIIAYNLCFCTCLGKASPPKPNTLGVSSYSPEMHVVHKLKNEMFFTPNGVMYVPPKVRKGVLPRLLEEILSTRIMVKQAMKKLDSSQKVLQRIFNARQLALKLISNVTYGYTAAGFSGRMPCAELADSIVQCGRRTLESAISFVDASEKWKAKVIYGDTDSMFVLLEGRTVEEAFRIGQEIASEITRMNPDPVTLKMEKVYHPCFLFTKKRYVGFSYESPDQMEPIFDAKGIETVRRDTCAAVAKTMEQSLRVYFEHQDISKVKTYLQRQWKRIIAGRISLQDFIFAKEVRLGTYSTRTASSLPPAAIVATKAMQKDPRAEPRYGERVPYVVVHGDPGARLVDMVVDPLDLLVLDSPYRLNDQYYINKQIIPALQRVFGLVGADLNQWLSEIPRPIREAFGKHQHYAPNAYRARIDYYYLSRHCVLCGELAQSSKHFCENCSRNKPALATTVIRKTSKLEKDMQHLASICGHCGGGDWIVESGVKCISLACSVFYERRKVQKELQGMSAVATESGLYPKCMAELF